MPSRGLSNISIARFREFLDNAGCKHIRTSGGHEVWTRKDLTRSVIFQTHIEPYTWIYCTK